MTQEWLVRKTKIGRNTISKIASDKDYEPKLSTIKRIMKAINEVDPNAKSSDFFDI
jgi:predicted transcriptional regulator